MTLFIVCEDQLSETVMRRMISNCFSSNFLNIVALSKRGRSYIQGKINGFNNQNKLHFFILADLNSDECAPCLIDKWVNRSLKQNILLRIAVREIESWLLADTKGFSEFSKLDHSFIKKEVNSPDDIPDPKGKLISMVDRSKSRDLKSDIVRKEKSSYKQGPGYNSRLADYVNNYWKIERAAELSDSFKRAVNSLSKFTKGFGNGKY